MLNNQILYVRPGALYILAYLLVVSSCVKKRPDVLPGFEIHPDFQLELAASEPLIFDPVDLEFDENGLAYALEMPGYPLRDEESRIIILEDTDGDGVFDQRTVYADHLGVASSIMCYREGILVAAPPYLLWVKDTDGDKTVDLRDTIMSGFSVGNLQHNFNGLTYGLDNWIYAANGGNSGRPYFGLDSSQAMDLRGDDFRLRIDERQIQRVGHSSGGFELAFDQYGRMFETHNLEHVSHLVMEGKYVDGLPLHRRHTLYNISDHEENGLSRIYPIGEQETRVNHPEQSGYFSGACGITYYGDAVFPAPYNEALFVADCVLNLVHIDLFEPSGSTFAAYRDRDKVEFLASTDRAFRPVNMTMGPEGALYVIDMYRTVIEHPEWIPDDIEATLDLADGKEKGRIYKILPKNQTPGRFQPLTRSDVKFLINALHSNNSWTRINAQRLLVEGSRTEAIPLLTEAFNKTDNPAAKTHILWTLEGLDAIRSELIVKGLQDAEPGLRENSLRMAEPHLVEESTANAVLNLLEDKHDRVRMWASLILSTLPSSQLEAYQQPIIEAGRRALTADQGDEWNRMALVAVLSKLPQNPLTELVVSLTPETEVNAIQLTGALSVVTARKGEWDIMTDVIHGIASSDQPTNVKAAILESFERGLSESTVSLQQRRGVLNAIRTDLDKIELNGQLEELRASMLLRNRLGLSPSPTAINIMEKSKMAMLDESLPGDERIKHLKLISLLPFNERENVLYEMLNHSAPIALQEEALQQLWNSRKPEIGVKLVEIWSSLGPHTRRIAGDILLYNESYHDALLTGLENGSINIGEMNFDLERRRTLLWWTDNENTKRRAEALFKDSGVINRREVMEKMKPALALSGNAQKGRNVYEQLCGQCHVHGQIGQDVGPVLTEIGRKSKESLLHDILDPNAAVDTRYINHRVITTSGETHIGIVETEGDSDITLKKMGGATVTIHKSEVSSFSSLGSSMMMEGLEANMSHQQLADLLAYLQIPS